MGKRAILVFAVTLGIAGLISAEEGDFFMQRKKMVESQIMKRGIHDQRVLDAMLKVQRHFFLPHQL